VTFSINSIKESKKFFVIHPSLLVRSGFPGCILFTPWVLCFAKAILEKRLKSYFTEDPHKIRDYHFLKMIYFAAWMEKNADTKFAIHHRKHHNIVLSLHVNKKLIRYANNFMPPAREVKMSEA
jgi:hypothetical protein